ncbi:MAG TPA: serine/threonine-protein kinase [Planctomycetaceae bacterium]|nr:serine/threonine-protein kinase [Planctomycetaceae bacterium]
MIQALIDNPLAAERPADVAEAMSFVWGLLREWPRDGEFPARRILEEHPGLWRVPEAVMELAYEEYTRRTRAGEAVSIDEFVAQFPDVAEKLRGDLEFDDCVQHDPKVARELDEHYFPSPGATFLGFHLLEQLGQGQCSRVYVARESDVGDRTVVVKLCMDGNREAQALGRLEHPGIVPVHSVKPHRESSLVALCMPYLTRATLHHVVEFGFSADRPPLDARTVLDAVAAVNGKRVFPAAARHTPRWWSRQSYVDAIVDVGIQLAETLAFVHQAGGCHGDLKPSNVLVTAGGRALLLDFNLSSWAVRDGALGGTLPYMAPEQLGVMRDGPGPRPARWDTHADLFGLAASLYHLLTGRMPFGPPPESTNADQRASEMLDRHRRGPVEPERFNPQVGADLSRLLAACLSWHRANRPQTAVELAAALRGHFAPLRRARRWVGRHRVRTLAIGALAASAVVGAGRLDFASGSRSSTGDRARVAPVPDLTVNQHQIDLAEGLEAIRRQQYEMAVEHLTRFLDQEPNHLDAIFARGQARMMLGEECLRLADEKLFQGRREDAKGFGDRGREEFAQARLDFRAVAAATGHSMAKACDAYAAVMTRSRETDPTVVQNFVEGIGPRFPAEAAWNNAGYAQLYWGDFQAARESLETALGHNENLAAAHYNLAQVSLNKAAQSGGTLANSRQSRIECFERALSCVQRSIDLGFRDYKSYTDKARALGGLWRELDRLQPRTEELTSRLEESRRRAVEACQQAVRCDLPRSELSAILGQFAFLRAEFALHQIPEPEQRPRTFPRLISPLAELALPVPLDESGTGG